MKNKITFLICIIFIAIVLKLLTLSPKFIENFYSRKAYKVICGSIGKVTSYFSFSIAEILLFIFIILILLFFVFSIKKIIFGQEKLKLIFNFLYVVVCIAIIIYIVFMSVWGLNYYRFPLINNYQNYFFENNNITDEEAYNKLYSLAELLIKDLNDLQTKIKYEISINTNYQALNRMVESEYNKVFEEFPYLEMYYSRTKPIKISKLFLRLQITGIYSPFTSEANVNTLIPYTSMPYTIAHEMAHKIGIAYEDEANFIAYLACSKHSDLFIQYSGAFEALLYVLSELNRDENYAMLISNLNEKTKEEIRYNYEFWNQYRGQLSNISHKVNDTYLKANNQIHGIKSYSRVVKLLIYYNMSKGFLQ